MKHSDLFAKLAADEKKFSEAEFFSPVIKNTPIKIKINGILLSLSVSKKKFEGWGVFKTTSFKEATFIRKPTMSEKREYFSLFPALRLILCRNENKTWYGIPANLADNRFKISGTIPGIWKRLSAKLADNRFKISGMVPVRLCEETQLFDTVQCRFDGTNVWFEEIYENHPAQNAIYLRESFTKVLDPKELNLSGLTAEEKDVYAAVHKHFVLTSEAYRKEKEEGKIKEALQRTGANYHSHVDRGDTYTIEYSVDGQKFKTVVSKNLEVQSAGICLAGGDKAFDLQSLVGVIREGRDKARIVVGDFSNYPPRYDDYDDYNDY